MQVEPREIERRLDVFKAAAREAGVKLTHQRLEIFREIAGSLEHPDAETIHKSVLPRLPTVSLDTVYRTLWLLSDLKLVDTLGPRRDSVRFDANMQPHHHFLCTRCGMTRDFEEPDLDGLRLPECVASFGTIEASRLEVRGVCRACLGSSPSEQPNGASRVGAQKP